MDLNEVVGTRVTDGGVLNVTRGHVVSAQVREGLRNLLQAFDAEGYAEYRAIKYPEGKGSDTPESRVAATRFIFDRARDVLSTHYLSMKE